MRSTGWQRGSIDLPNKVADLEFLLYEYGDLSYIGSFLSGRSGEFLKSPLVNVTVHLCLEFAGLGGIRSCAPMLLFLQFGSGGSVTKLHSLLLSSDFWSMVKSKMENIIKAGLKD
jgi:hypothetical protein